MLSDETCLFSVVVNCFGWERSGCGFVAVDSSHEMFPKNDSIITGVSVKDDDNGCASSELELPGAAAKTNDSPPDESAAFSGIVTSTQSDWLPSSSSVALAL